MHRRARRSVGLLVLSVVLGACGGGSGGAGGSESEGNGGGDAIAQTPTAPPTTSPTAAPPASITPPPQPATTEIRLLALTTPGVQALYPDPTLRVAHLVNVSNQVLRDSLANLRIELAGVRTVAYPDGGDMDTVLDDLTFGTHPDLAEVATWRSDVRADLVVLLRPYANDGRCGVAWIGGYQSGGDMSRAARYGYSLVAIDCSDYTLLHELGHNLGLAHSRRENPRGGSLPYGVGHGVDGRFATIMAPPGDYNAPRVPRLSSPLLDCDGAPCGVDRGDTANGADAVHALHQTMDQVAAYQP